MKVFQHTGRPGSQPGREGRYILSNQHQLSHTVGTIIYLYAPSLGHVPNRWKVCAETASIQNDAMAMAPTDSNLPFMVFVPEDLSWSCKYNCKEPGRHSTALYIPATPTTIACILVRPRGNQPRELCKMQGSFSGGREGEGQGLLSCACWHVSFSVLDALLAGCAPSCKLHGSWEPRIRKLCTKEEKHYTCSMGAL